MSPRGFSFGDRLTHAAKPEWGVGHVVQAQSVKQGGVECQRLQVRFERAGLKTLSTAVADLRPADAVDAGDGGASESRAEAEATASELEENPQEVMSRVPEAARDPFCSPAKRLERTLELYRYEPEGASLLDWAATQSGLRDPLEVFNRHQLEAFFERFRVNLDRHVEKLVRELGRQGGGVVEQLKASAPPAAREALRRANARR